MLYRPNFCCNCGEKIERADWSIFTSRRFCGVCETEYKGADYLPRVAAGAAALVIVLGIASYFRSGHARPPAPAVDAPPRQRMVMSSDALKPIEKPTPDLPLNSSMPPAGPAQSSQSPAPAVNSLQRQNSRKTSTESVYYCGALTRKGTPCTRRVKTNGRCWQHQGQPSAAEFR